MRRFGRQELRVESFELVEVGAGLALLRLAGEWRSGTPDGVRLVASGSGVAQELPALPEPPAEPGDLWRAAFSAEGDVQYARFRLHTSDGRSVTLPAPVVPQLAPETYEPEPEPVAARVEPQAPEQSWAAERARAERTEASLREQLRILVSETAEFMGRLEGYELRRAELEKELSWERLLHKETRRKLDAAEAERDEATVLRDERAAARRQLAEARERIVELERRLEQQDELLGNVRATVDRGSAQLAGLEERLLRLRDSGLDKRAPEAYSL